MSKIDGINFEGFMLFLTGTFLGLAVGAFSSAAKIERENLTIPFNGNAKFAVEKGYINKTDLTQMGEDFLSKESKIIIMANLK